MDEPAIVESQSHLKLSVVRGCGSVHDGSPLLQQCSRLCDGEVHAEGERSGVVCLLLVLSRGPIDFEATSIVHAHQAPLANIKNTPHDTPQQSQMHGHMGDTETTQEGQMHCTVIMCRCGDEPI